MPVLDEPANMTQCWAISAILLFFVTVSTGEERPVTETSLGKVRGHYKQSYDGRKFAAYEGIPYAKPPIGSLRFEEPIEVETWSGIWDATIVHTCMQLPLQANQSVGNEDCLYLNVYVPEDDAVKKSNLDVIVHIHGGAFMMGNPNIAGPKYIMDRNVIYVNINYRLGVLGFLSTEDEVVPGNNGMKDQVMALRWVQKHIKPFGGNPNSVTITGLSAGGASVHLHYFSPLSKGLFHKGVSQGGTALAPWVIDNAPLERAKRLAASIGCSTSSTKELVACLKKRPACQVIQNSYDSPIVPFPIAPFSPVIEKSSSGAFLTEHPYKLLKSGNINDVPWITGSATEEGILGLMFLHTRIDDLNKHWNSFLPYILDYNDTAAESDRDKVARDIKKFYFDNKDVSEENIKSFIKLIGDRYFYTSLETSAKLHAKVAQAPVYLYIYGYKGDVGTISYMGLEKDYGVGHGYDAQFLYDIQFPGFVPKEEKFSENDENVKKFWLDTFASFARSGKPLPKDLVWEPVLDDGGLNYMFIHNSGIKMASKEELAPSGFWQTLPLREYDNQVLIKEEL